MKFEYFIIIFDTFGLIKFKIMQLRIIPLTKISKVWQPWSRSVEIFLGKILGVGSFGGGGLSTINSRYPLEFCFNEFSLLCFKINNLINILSLLRSIK